MKTKVFLLSLLVVLFAAQSVYADAPEGVEMVDLGLSSGTLWANMNVGATTSEGYGDYFAWGETYPKDFYDETNYKYFSINTITKYCTDSIYGTVDNKTVLDPEDDAAHVNWGGDWRMPTKEEQDELRNNCTWTWTTLNGVNGFQVEGKNNNSIFLPAAGYYFNSVCFAESNGNYWSSSLCTDYSDFASRLYFYSNSDSVGWAVYYRYYGQSVRPVIAPANNIITYTATEKLPEITDTVGDGLHVNAFNVKVVSHEFSNGVGTITFADEVTTIGEWAFGECSSLISVTIPSSVTSIGYAAFFLVNNIVYNGTATGSPWGAKCRNGYVENYLVYSDISKTTVCGCSSSVTGAMTIPNSVTSIREGTFVECNGLISLTIPSNVMSIGEGAFSGCTGLTSMTCYATNPPTCGKNCFNGIDTSIPVYVPAQSVEIYKQAEEWKAFTNILPIAAEETEVTEPVINADNHSVTITWPQTDNADTYTLEIRKNGELVCTLTFNNQGIMTNITFAAPARGRERTSSNAKMTANGYRFTVIGLETNTEYTYAVTAKNASAQPIQTYSGQFRTTGTTGLENLTIDKKVGNKFIYGNQLYLRRGNKFYNAFGGKMR